MSDPPEQRAQDLKLWRQGEIWMTGFLMVAIICASGWGVLMYCSRANRVNRFDQVVNVSRQEFPLAAMTEYIPVQEPDE